MEELNALVAQLDYKALLVVALRVSVVIVGAWILLFILRFAFRRLETFLVSSTEDEESPIEAAKRVETLIRLVRQAVRIVVWIVALLIVLRELGIDIAPILASAGIVGLAVGFGAQSLVKDVITGFFIILENQLRVGDVAVINGTGGLVESINLRTIVLRDLSGTVHIFPNGSINTLANLTHGWSAYVFDIGVAYKEDVDHVIEIMREEGKKLREDPQFAVSILDDIEVFGVDSFADSAVVIKGRIRTKPIKQWEVGREYRRRLKHAFDREGIEIPFPQRAFSLDEQTKQLLSQLAAKPAS